MSAPNTAMNLRSEPFRDIIEESLEEAAFLWRRWESELTSLTRNLDEIWTWTEDRLHGALDGARVGGHSTLEQLITPALNHQDAAYTTVAAYLLVSDASDAALDALNQALKQAQPAKLSALMRGIETATLSGRFAPLSSMLAKHSIEHCAALCRLKAFQRATLGQELRELYSSNVPAMQVTAMQAAAHLPANYISNWVEAGLQNDHINVRQAAMLTGIRARVPQAWTAAVQMTQAMPDECSALFPALAMFGSAAEHALLQSAISVKRCARAAVRALAHIGTPETVDALLELLSDAELGRVAGEAYCTIAGVELERDHLMLSDHSNDESPAFEADDLDANLVPPEEEQWPIPDANACKTHWDSIRGNFAPGMRYVRGLPVSLQRLIAMVESGPMLRRTDHIYELAARSAGKYDVEARAFTATQRRMMSAARAQMQA